MKKIKCLGYSLLPLLVWLGIQIMISTGTAVSVTALWRGLAILGVKLPHLTEYLKREYLSILSVLSDIAFLILGYFWFQRLRRQEKGETGRRAVFGGKAWIRLFFLGVALQLIMSLFLMILTVVAPESMEKHSEVMQNLGMLSPSFWSILYTVLVAPVAEELLCRGLTLKILEKSFSFWTANVIQALYFGLLHGNLVQGVYAFFSGILCGIIVRRYGTLKAGIFFHMVVNLSGNVLAGLSINGWQYLLLCVVSILPVVFLREEWVE